MHAKAHALSFECWPQGSADPATGALVCARASATPDPCRCGARPRGSLRTHAPRHTGLCFRPTAPPDLTRPRPRPWPRPQPPSHRPPLQPRILHRTPPSKSLMPGEVPGPGCGIWGHHSAQDTRRGREPVCLWPPVVIFI
uniref:Uncharacterized protein n=1 Tax=Rousettus aegyptiacus TaxID=9407 RepID=A0A7J8F0N0_ROUAE|nr:hypothetical protein HJG63_012448 [Rousettus aegyptiacus]